MRAELLPSATFVRAHLPAESCRKKSPNDRGVNNSGVARFAAAEAVVRGVLKGYVAVKRSRLRGESEEEKFRVARIEIDCQKIPFVIKTGCSSPSLV